MGGSRDTGRTAGEGPSMVVGTRGITEAVVGGELGVAEGLGMEEMEVYFGYVIVYCVCICILVLFEKL